MAFDDMTVDQLQLLASEHEIAGRSGMNKAELIETLREAGVTEDNGTVSGFQEGMYYPKVPVTPDDFRALLPNPDKPPENQSAPSPQQLNPHLFGPQGRIPS